MSHALDALHFGRLNALESYDGLYTMLRPILFLAFLAVVSSSLFGWADESYQPLFVIERSTNENAVHYDAKIAQDGDLDARKPIVVYWIMGAKDGRRQELSFLEKTKAYGITVEPGQTLHSYRIALVSDRQREIEVYREGNAFRAETIIEGRRAYLRKIYVSVRKGPLFSLPGSIELIGTDIATGEGLREIIAPGR